MATQTSRAHLLVVLAGAISEKVARLHALCVQTTPHPPQEIARVHLLTVRHRLSQQSVARGHLTTVRHQMVAPERVGRAHLVLVRQRVVAPPATATFARMWLVA